MNFYTTYGACLKSQDIVDSVFFKIVKTPVKKVATFFAKESSTPMS